MRTYLLRTHLDYTEVLNGVEHLAVDLVEANDKVLLNLTSPHEVIKRANHLISKRFSRKPRIESTTKAMDLLRLRLAPLPFEVFACLWLATDHKMIAFDELFRGTIDRSSVYPREVVKQALHYNAAAVILAHNHPSGSPEPSQGDLDLTKQLSAALDLVGVRVLDHIIVGDGEVSLAERGIQLR